MVMHAQALVALRQPPPLSRLRPPEPLNALLDNLEDIKDEEHIILLGRDGPDLMCTLLRAGARRVTYLCSHEWLEAGSASLIIAPTITSADWLDSAIPSMRRALVASGRIILGIDSVLMKQRRVQSLLKLQGFCAGTIPTIGFDLLCARRAMRRLHEVCN